MGYIQERGCFVRGATSFFVFFVFKIENLKKVVIHPKKEDAIGRRHPWIFSGAILKNEDSPEDGDVVEVFSAKGKYLATGHWHDGSIAIRIFSFEPTDAGQQFWNEKVANAFNFRQKTGLTDSKSTNCYRLINAEGDGLPGLIIDVYDKTAVVQCHTVGMHRSRHEIAKAVMEQYDGELRGVFDKSAETLPERYAATVKNGYLSGQSGPSKVLENDHLFQVDWEGGQKTGFFLDQRDNRALLANYAAGKKILNAFCYSGGFSVYALHAGATEVHSVDVSAKAIELTEKNIQLARPFAGAHQSFTADVMQFLKNSTEEYDVMIVDPPAFAKNISKRHNAVQGYKRLNALAMEKVSKGGFLFTFSCSQVVDRQLFYDTILAAAIEAGRPVRVLHHLSQPADHPVNIFHPEGAYLKGLVLEIG